MSENSYNPSRGLRAVIFDYGEVLCHRPTPDEIARLAGFFGVDNEQFSALWERNRGPYDRGDLTAKVYWSMLAEDAGTTIKPGQLEEICALDMAMWSNVNSGMVNWALQLASCGLKLALLSNMHPDMVAHARRHFAWLKSFDCLTFSGEKRMIKPDPAIYELTLRDVGVAAAESLFLDDREINIRAARALGMHAIRFQSIMQLRGELQSVGFPILPGNS